MKYLGILASILVFYHTVFAQTSSHNDSLIISEIMFYALSGNNEYFELYNLSSTNYFDLRNYQLKYYTSLPDSITDAGFGTILPPNRYAVIFEKDYDIQTGIYNNLVPDSALILKITSSSFGSNGMANTTSRPVWLISPGNDTIDCIYYSADNSASYSDEKRVLNRDTSSAVWGNSFILNGTPGFRNSIQETEYDIKICRIKIFPDIPFPEDDLDISITILNKGHSTAYNFELKLYNDSNSDSIPDDSELLYSELYSSLGSGDSISVVHSLYNLMPGEYRIIAKVNFVKEEFPIDNTAYLIFNISDKTNYNDVIINEIMFAPQNGEPEWVEIYNNSMNPINFKKWRIKDAASSILISSLDCVIMPGDYLVLSKDSLIKNYYPFEIRFIIVSLPALNNTGDWLSISDSLGFPVDTLNYLPEWGGNNNRSLERINSKQSSIFQENWGTSTNPYRATPGFVNSITQKVKDICIEGFEIEENYGVVGEPIRFVVVVKNKGIQEVTGINISLYKDIQNDSLVTEEDGIAGFIVNDLLPGENEKIIYVYNDITESENCFIIDIKNDDDDLFNNRAYKSVNGINVSVKRSDIIINEIMYAPEEEPEWLELYNNSGSEINLKNFLLSDKNDTVPLLRTDRILGPDKFIVVFSDSSLLRFRNIPSEYLETALPNFNNIGDKVILMDSLYRVIDSLEYDPAWGGGNGYSLERIESDSSSTDSVNWRPSINKYKGTPGYVNSVSEKLIDVIVESIQFSPAYPVKGDMVGISLLIKNNGQSDSGVKLNLYNNQTSIPVYSTDLVLPSRSSAVISSDYKIAGIIQTLTIRAELVVENDQDTSNNYMTQSVDFGYKPGCIIINEIHYNPGNGEAEWIELYNNSEDSINIKDWIIKDVFTTPSSGTIRQDYFFLPYSYLLISSDSSVVLSHKNIPSDLLVINIPNLNNDRDGVVLGDYRGVTIDSIIYEGSVTHNSIERVSADILSTISQNWSQSRDLELSTPGRINSVTPKSYDLAVCNIEISPRFPVLNDSIEIAVEVSSYGMLNAGEFQVNFFADEKAIAAVKISAMNSGETMTIKCPVKLELTTAICFKVRIEYSDDADQFNNSAEVTVTPGEKQGSIVINEIMYDPDKTSSEWAEIYNASNSSINLKGWSISDITPLPFTGIITDEDVNINPGDYFIISQDSSISTAYPNINNLLYSKFGSLSSISDGIVLYDYRKGVIDSVKYNYRWGGRNGRSLERKLIHGFSTDSSNWNSSLSPLYATPGEKNSVSDLPANLSSSVVINEIMYDPGFDNCEFIELFNRTDSEINLGGWRFGMEENDSFIISDSNYTLPPRNYFVFAADSIILKKYGSIGLLVSAQVNSLNLSNSGKMILLRDINGLTIDSLIYFDKFHNNYFSTTKNRSLERINPDINSNDESNWTTSVSSAGATPGIMNSIITKNHSSATELSISPNPFSPDNDGWEDFAIINYSFDIETPNLRVLIFDSQGRLVRTLADVIPSGSTGTIIYDGRDDEGRALRIGIYILFIEASGIKVTKSHKIAFVIARKL